MEIGTPIAEKGVGKPPGHVYVRRQRHPRSLAAGPSNRHREHLCPPAHHPLHRPETTYKPLAANTPAGYPGTPVLMVDDDGETGTSSGRITLYPPAVMGAYSAGAAGSNAESLWYNLVRIGGTGSDVNELVGGPSERPYRRSSHGRRPASTDVTVRYGASVLSSILPGSVRAAFPTRERRWPLSTLYARLGPTGVAIEPPAEARNVEVELLLEYLVDLGQATIADRIRRFLDILKGEPDEPPIATKSLRSAVLFLAQHSNLIPPIVGSNLRGLLELEWHLQDNGDPGSIWGRGNGVVSLRFLESGNVQFVALSGPRLAGLKRAEERGEANRESIMSSLGIFESRVTAK